MSQQTTWHGLFDNPIKAVVRCMVSDRINEQEYPECIIFDLMLFPVKDQDDIQGYLDDLLQEIAGSTGIVVKFEGGMWYAAVDRS